ncbi:MAG: TonB-dependent receptor [Balneolaceae bacterium]|nr:MAG: TonB-dependent receptor [Balneolaceae bacterium]
MKVFFFLLLSLFGISSLYAQSGRISGKITDDRNELLTGAAIYIVEIERGAVADINGEYVLVNIPPGIYTLRKSYVGYGTLVINDVEVFSNRTTFLDSQMRAEAYDAEEIVLTAERPIVQRDRTSTATYLQRETIEELPVTNLSDLVRFQPGVVATDDGFSFRGGRTREVAYVIDGIPVQDIYSQAGGNTVNIELTSIQELQVLTGTFDAEHGGAQSGVVSISTRNPSPTLEASLQVRSGGYFAGSDRIFIGGDRYKPFESNEFTVTVTGPVISRDDKLGFFITGRYGDNVGHLKGQRRFTIDDGLVIDAYRFWYREQFSPDDARLISLDTARSPSGEPILDSNGNPITFANGDNAIVPMSWSRTAFLNPKLVFRPTSRSRLVYSVLLNRSEGQGFNTNKRFSLDGRLRNESYSITNILSYNQSFNSKVFLTLRGSYKFSKSKSAAFSSFDDERYQYFSASDATTGLYFGGTENSRNRFEEQQLILSADLTWQFNSYNEIKTGLQFRWNEFYNYLTTIGWVRPSNPDQLAVAVRPPNASSYVFFDEYLEALRNIPLQRVVAQDINGSSREFVQDPIEFAYFLQNKLELGSNIITKVGLRFEYFDTRQPYLINTRQQSEFIGRSDNLAMPKPKTYLSPRVGISFPVSETGAFRVAYGHFTQMPAYSRLFQNPVDENTNQGRLLGTTVGNPDLLPERTVNYEMGLQQQLSNFIGLDINLYYKNVRNLLGLEILATSDGTEYFRTVNRDYGLIKGGTIALVTRSSGYLQSLGFDITYEDARGSSSNPSFIADVIVAGRAGEVGDVVIDRQIIPLNWDQTLTANTYLTIGVRNNWNIGLVGQLATGQPYTPTFISTDKVFPSNFFDNTENRPVILTLDATFDKQIQIAGLNANFRVQINNLLNRQNERTVYSTSGRAGQQIRLPFDQAELAFVNSYVGLFSNRDADLRPTWYSAPRQILFSLQISI